jgi:hypothetical protein
LSDREIDERKNGNEGRRKRDAFESVQERVQRKCTRKEAQVKNSFY